MAKILVVEDEAPIANAYRIVMEQAGHTVAVAGDVATALELWHKERPAIILLDILLPGVNGLDFLKQLGAPKGLGSTKVIALSNIETRKVVEEAKHLGVAEYLPKVQFTPHQLLDVVNQQLSES